MADADESIGSGVVPEAPFEPEHDGVVGQAGSLLVGRLVASAMSYFGTIVIARTLSTSDWGGYTFALSLSGLVVLVLDFQVSRLVVVELARSEDTDPSTVISSLVTLRALIGLFAGLVAVGITVAVGSEGDVVLAVLLFTGALVFSSAWGGLSVWYQHRLELSRIGSTLIATRLVYVAGVVGLVLAGVEWMPAYVLPGVALEIVTLAVLLRRAQGGLRVRPRIDVARWKRWLREAAPIAIGGAIGLAYYRLDIVMLTVIDDLEATGLYGVAYKFTDIIGYIPVALLAAVFPLLVRAWPGDTDGFGANVRGAFVLLLATAVLVAVSFGVVAADVVAFLYGEKFREAGTAATLVVAGEGLRFLTALCVQTLIAIGRNRTYPLVAALGLVLNIALNLVLIPAHSYRGAATATVITELTVLGLLLPLVIRLPGVRFPSAPTIRIVGAGIAALVLGLVLREEGVVWPAGALASVAAFLLVLHTAGLDGPGGLRVVRRLVRGHGAT